MNWIQIIESASVVCTLLYNFWLIRQSLWCWPAGFFSSVFGSWVMYEKQLPGQAVLYLFYALMAVYGFFYWWKGKKHKRRIHDFTFSFHILSILGIFAISLGYYFFNTHVRNDTTEFWDICITLFCVFATWMETRKVLTGWIYWIVLNAISIWLYASHEIYGLAGLSLVYVGLSVRGYMRWRVEYLAYAK